MASTSIHQAVHGYRDGHKLLSSSTPLGSEAARTMLVLSDMSGPSMQPGFDEYITGYPVAGTDYFALAKTWYAPEMQRPGCVWTHSLLIPRSQVASIVVSRLLMCFRRPQAGGVDAAATAPIVINCEAPEDTNADGLADKARAAAVLGAVLGQPRPVIVVADIVSQFEAVILRIWEGLWPAERTRFSFCTGALMPRLNAGALLDLQAVPRAIPPSQFRRSASAAFLLDLRAQEEHEAWVDLVLDGALKGNLKFPNWLEAAAGPDATRAIVPSLGPIYSEWYASGSSARSVLASVVNGRNIEAGTCNRLLDMVFERANQESGTRGRRELLQDLCGGCQGRDLAPCLPTLEDQTRQIFDGARSEGIALVLSLLGSELTELGEHLLRIGVLLLEPSDLGSFSDAQAPYLPTIVGVNHRLAASPVLWDRIGHRSGEVLSQLGGVSLTEEILGAIVEAILSSARGVSVDALIRFGGRIAMFRGLAAIASGRLRLSWQWRSALGAQPDAVLAWLESISVPSIGELDLGSRFLSPQFAHTRLQRVWMTGVSGTGTIPSRVASFGLTLAFAEGDANSPLLAACFQTSFDAAASPQMDFEEWDWLQDHAPPTAWYRSWDRCERLAAVVARLAEKQNAPLATVFAIVHDRIAIKKFAAILDDDRKMRPYLKSLRNAAETSSVGTQKQRDALLEGRFG